MNKNIAKIIKTIKNRKSDVTKQFILISTYNTYRRMIIEKQFTLNVFQRVQFREFKRRLIKFILEHYVDVVFFIIINSNNQFIRNWNAYHVIVQEVERANNEKMFIIFVHQRESIVYISNDCEQLRSNHENLANNFFVSYINQSLMKRFLKLNYSHDFLNEQQRTIFLLNNIIFEIFYHDKIQSSSSVDANQSKIVIQIHQEILNIKELMILINLTDIKSQSINSTKSQQNVAKTQFAWELIKHYVLKKVEASDIVILSKYLKQYDLLKRLVACDLIIAKIKILIINVYHDKKNDFVIFSIATASKLDFMIFKNRVLVACNRIKWKFVIIDNFNELLNRRNQRNIVLHHVKRRFNDNELYVK